MNHKDFCKKLAVQKSIDQRHAATSHDIETKKELAMANARFSTSYPSILISRYGTVLQRNGIKEVR